MQFFSFETILPILHRIQSIRFIFLPNKSPSTQWFLVIYYLRVPASQESWHWIGFSAQNEPRLQSRYWLNVILPGSAGTHLPFNSSRLLQDSFPRGCMTEGPDFLLAIWFQFLWPPVTLCYLIFLSTAASFIKSEGRSCKASWLGRHTI